MPFFIYIEWTWTGLKGAYETLFAFIIYSRIDYNRNI
jgi:hypothetical protein